MAAAVCLAALLITCVGGKERHTVWSFSLLAICLISWNLGVGLTSVPGFGESHPFITMGLRAIILLIPATILHTARAWSGTATQWSFRLLVAAYLVCFCFSLAQTRELIFEGTQDLGWGRMGRPGPLLPAFTVVLVACTAIGLKLCRSRLASRTMQDTVALHARCWALGAAPALALGSTNILVNYGVPILPLGSVGSLWIIGVLAYVALTHRLVDPNLFAFKVGGVSLVSAPVIATAFVAWHTVQGLPTGVALSLLVGALVAAFSVGLVLFPAYRMYVERGVETSLLPIRRAARQSLQSFSANLAKVQTREEITSQLPRVLMGSVGVAEAGVFVPTSKKDQFKLCTTLQSSTPSETICLNLSEARNGAPIPGVGGWEVVVPAMSCDRPVAVIALGPKISGTAIDDSDRTVLSMVAAQLAVALQNVECRDEIEDQRRQIEELRRRFPVEDVLLRADARVFDHEALKDIVGCSAALHKTLQGVLQFACSDSSILITGETGTGKELIARALHKLSNRAKGPLVCINCPAIPVDIAESELFGCDRGAFTGAVESRAGKFEFADGGTLFLDEVADLPQTVQVKLLRVLEEHQVQRLGSNRTRCFNIRVISATNRNLFEEVRQGRFREDLYYRIASVSLHVPPLRDRLGDVQILAATFLKRAAAQYQKEITGISQDALDILTSYPWPGNVRELQHAIERAVLLCSSAVLQAEHFSELSRVEEEETAAPRPTTLTAAMREEKLRRVRNALTQTNGNQAAAARLLGMSRSNLSRLIKRYGIDPLEFVH